MNKLIAKNQLTLTNVDDGQSINDNLFSATNFALTKYAHPSQPTALISWKYNGKPNTKYTLSTDVPKGETGIYDVFFYVYPSTPSSYSNGVAINEPRTITTDGTGIIEITARKGVISDSIIAKTSRVKLEENDMMTAFIFHPDDQIGPRGIQGLQGPQGADGKTQYTHIAYADDATGEGFSQTDQTKAYIGMYQDFTATDSNDPTKYRWTKWKGSDGAQGTPGVPGTDGKTPYIHFAYADDDKGTNFSLTDNNQQYQGYYSDFTEADSTDYRKYKWVDRLANVQVGAVNLVKQSTAQKDLRLGIDAVLINDGNHMLTDWIKIEPNTTYTLTTYENVDDPDAWYSLAWYSSNANDYSGWISRPTGAARAAGLKGGKQYTSPANAVYAKVSYPTNYPKVKLERGNISTDYSLASEDTQEQIDSKADQTLTQDQLNALEAKRLQMEVELKAKATLEQVSELETFINNLKQEDTDGRQKIIEITKAIEERVKDIEPIMEYSKKLQFMDTYITQGNGGMVIGANDSTTKVVVTPDRISFQSGGSEVAYISQRMLHIDNGVFTMSLQLGHYITRAHPKNEYVNATYFVK